MAVKLSLDHIILLEVYSFKGFSNHHKNDKMVNNNSNSVTSSDCKKSANTAKDC